MLGFYFRNFGLIVRVYLGLGILGDFNVYFTMRIIGVGVSCCFVCRVIFFICLNVCFCFLLSVGFFEDRILLNFIVRFGVRFSF